MHSEHMSPASSSSQRDMRRGNLHVFKYLYIYNIKQRNNSFAISAIRDNDKG